MSTCPTRSAASTSTSRRPRPITSAAPATMPASRRWKKRSATTSQIFSTPTIAIAESRSPMFDFETQLAALGRQTVLCIGDLMLDYFVYGEVSRISPEAPAPVIAVAREDIIVGGAGNVARNVAGLGARCIFLGVVGKDADGNKLKSELTRNRRRIKAHLVVDPS